MARSPAVADRHRFILLDGLRGVAAIAVMLFHFGNNRTGLIWFKHGYLAVDFFFVLSGFVITHAYEQRLRSSMTMRAFVAARALRLLPLLAFAVGMTLLFHLVLNRGRSGQGELILAALLNMALLPSLWLADRYPMVLPSWSLAYEMAVNLLYAAALRWLGTRTLVVIVAAAGVLNCATIVHHGTVDGLYHDLSLGMARTIASFGLGVLIARWYRGTGHRTSPLHAVWLTGLLMALLMTPMLDRGNAAFEIVTTMLVMPAIVAIAATVRLSARAASIGDLLGRLSYPVYVLHEAAFFLLNILFGKVHRATPLGLAPIFTLVAAWLVLRAYDEPLRARLARMLHARQTEPAESAP